MVQSKENDDDLNGPLLKSSEKREDNVNYSLQKRGCIMRNNLAYVVLISAVMYSSVWGAIGITWSLSSDMSSASNPNGQWRYYTNGTSYFSSVNGSLIGVVNSEVPNAGVGWYASAPNDHIMLMKFTVDANPVPPYGSGDDKTNFLTNDVGGHSPTGATWTAPEDGTYQIDYLGYNARNQQTATGGELGRETDLVLRVNGVEVDRRLIKGGVHDGSANAYANSSIVSLLAGQTVDLVQEGGDLDWVGLDMTITGMSDSLCATTWDNGADIDNDGEVNLDDFSILAEKWLATGTVLPDAWVDVRAYSSLTGAVTAIGSDEKTILIPEETPVNAYVTIPANISLWFVKGGSLNIAAGYSVTINGSITAGLYEIFKGDGTIQFGDGSTKEVYPEWWGAKGDDSTDCTLALTKAVNVCGLYKTLKLSDGIYRISSVIETMCSIKGNSPVSSAIHNVGTGDALYIPGPYYGTWSDFSVKGNPASRDGITLYTQSGDNNAYSSFRNVYSHDNGRHGLYHRCAWATKYIECKFYNNGGLGVFLDTQQGDSGTHNGITFLNCESRWNGGNDSTTTQNDDKGGVKIIGAAMVSFIGGIYESNNAWGFIISNQGYWATRNIHIRNIYMEDTPHAANVGGLFYLGGVWENVTVEQSWLGYGTEEGRLGYCFYVDRTIDAAVFKERDNFTVGGPSAIKFYGTTHDKPEVLISPAFGDIGAGNIATSTTVATISNDGKWMVSGFIHAKRNSDVPGGVFPFIASRDSTSARSVSVGSSIAGSATVPPTMSFVGDELRISLAPYHYAFVEVREQMISPPTTFEWEPSLFGVMMRRR